MSSSQNFFDLESLVCLRRDIHQNAELSLKEFATQAKIKHYLTEVLKIDTLSIKHCANTGLTLDIYGFGPPNLSLKSDYLLIGARADIDALPMKEETDLAFKSTGDAMHACGHDGHIACLLGGLSLYLERLDRIPANTGVRFIFQPGEEGHHGADLMVKDGVLDDVSEIYGCHNVPMKSLAGKMVCNVGNMMAAFTIIDIKIIGRGGHGSTPEKCKNPIPVAAKVYLEINGLMDEAIKNNKEVRGSFPLLKGSEAFNVIPEFARIAGTLRNFEPEFAQKFVDQVEKTVQRICTEEGFEFKMSNIPSWHKPVKNSDSTTHFFKTAVAQALGPEFNTSEGCPIFASEDFSEFTAKIPGTFWFAAHGINPEGVTLHSPKFMFDDSIIEPTSKVWAKLFEVRLTSTEN